jgi:hypothetical protein
MRSGLIYCGAIAPESDVDEDFDSLVPADSLLSL